MNTLILIVSIPVIAVTIWAIYGFVRTIKELRQMEKEILESQAKLEKLGKEKENVIL